MKKIGILLFVLAMTFMACSKDENQELYSLIGTWEYTETYTDIGDIYVVTIFLTFNEDHTGVAGATTTINSVPEVTGTENISWTASNNILTIISTLDGTSSTIYTISGNKLTFGNGSESIVYTRK